MNNSSETGHAKNAANFEELISFITGFGATYNPSKAGIKLAALNTLSASVKTSIAAVNTVLATYKTAIDARTSAFDPLNKLVTRIMNAVIATDTNENVDKSARSFANKIQGKRITPKLTDDEKKKLTDSGQTVNEVSSSQMSFDNRLDNFDKLIQLITTIPQYIPNEADLKVTALTTLYTDLKTKNSAVIAAHTALTNARIARNDLLYQPLTGAVDLALDTKSYIKSLYGATSPQYKEVSGLQFTRAI